MSAPASKRQRTSPSYELLYHPGIPGRGEYIRLAFEAAGTPYTDVANDSRNGYSQVQKVMSLKTGDSDGNPPIFAPPALRVPEEGKDGKTLLISQTPNILLYLGPKLGLVPEDEVGRLHVNQLTLTALDLSNEAHDVHHPVGVSLYYEDQKEEAIRKAQDVRENRLPKFLGHFEGVLKGNEEEGKGKYLVGEKLTYADTTLWQVVDGYVHAFTPFYALPEKLKLTRPITCAASISRSQRKWPISPKAANTHSSSIRSIPTSRRSSPSIWRVSGAWSTPWVSTVTTPS